MLIGICVYGCDKHSDHGRILSLMQPITSCLNSPAITKGGAPVAGSSPGHYFYYYAGNGTTDSISFTSNPSGTGAGIYIGNSNSTITGGNYGISSNFTVYGLPSPFTQSIQTDKGSFRCFLVVIPYDHLSFSLKVQ
ncbi:hypothetical protein BES34_020385 [Leptospira inadai serovar Lyme]|uniref:Lipoprotein n=1 Tax=Leptospira inadai serovar Lyme TaxID=293084 RepID=A0ABX4YD81_9LEPT|nr:hypothetical protein BES34_020385 [Leptospira inadai serovar Lyme]